MADWHTPEGVLPKPLFKFALVWHVVPPFWIKMNTSKFTEHLSRVGPGQVTEPLASSTRDMCVSNWDTHISSSILPDGRQSAHTCIKTSTRAETAISPRPVARESSSGQELPRSIRGSWPSQGFKDRVVEISFGKVVSRWLAFRMSQNRSYRDGGFRKCAQHAHLRDSTLLAATSSLSTLPSGRTKQRLVCERLRVPIVEQSGASSTNERGLSFSMTARASLCCPHNSRKFR